MIEVSWLSRLAKLMTSSTFLFTKNAKRETFKNVAAYGKDSFAYGNKIDNLSKFDDNLEVLETYDDEEDDAQFLFMWEGE